MQIEMNNAEVDPRPGTMTQTLTKLYDLDYADWIADTVARLKAGDFAGLDLENVIEEMETLGPSECYALSSQWIRVVKHLLKLEAQPQAREYHNSWVSSVVEGLRRVEHSLKTSPSLLGYLRASEPEWYPQAVKEASIETRLPPANFPATCPSDLLELIAENYPETLRYFFVIE